MTINPKLVAALVVMLAQLADIYTTYVGIKRYGLHENNPLMAKLMEREGMLFAATAKVCFMLLLVMWNMRRGYSMHFSAGVSMLPAISNALAILERKYGA